MEGAVGQRDFYNAVVEVETTLGPRDLLSACKEIERGLGREPGRRHAPRPIDIDVLLMDGLRLDEPDLVIPHPGLADRAFVQIPLRELGAQIPVVAGQRVTRVESLAK
jgi:2-amino-4-hydroxy-6-hydroxymethyldihydropteridine diphosphokinase